MLGGGGDRFGDYLCVDYANTQSLAPQEGRHNECPPGLLGRKFIVASILQVIFKEKFVLYIILC